MKKLTLAVIAVSLIGATSVVSAADTTRNAGATATWQAKALKDTKSELVVTALDSLTFNYSEAITGFSTQDGLFSVTVAGQDGATDFKLAAKMGVATHLSRNDNSSELVVGAKWKGVALPAQSATADQAIDLINISKGISGGFETIKNGFAEAGKRSSDIGEFTFSVLKAVDMSTGTSTDVKFEDLADGMWTGKVDVDFIATWQGDFQ